MNVPPHFSGKDLEDASCCRPKSLCSNGCSSYSATLGHSDMHAGIGSTLLGTSMAALCGLAAAGNPLQLHLAYLPRCAHSISVRTLVKDQSQFSECAGIRLRRNVDVVNGWLPGLAFPVVGKLLQRPRTARSSEASGIEQCRQHPRRPWCVLGQGRLAGQYCFQAEPSVEGHRRHASDELRCRPSFSKQVFPKQFYEGGSILISVPTKFSPSSGQSGRRNSSRYGYLLPTSTWCLALQYVVALDRWLRGASAGPASNMKVGEIKPSRPACRCIRLW